MRAANTFKMAKKWAGQYTIINTILCGLFVYPKLAASCIDYLFVIPAAGHAFCEAAKVQLKLQSKHEAATNYVDAGNCYKKTDANGRLIDASPSHLSLYQKIHYIFY